MRRMTTLLTFTCLVTQWGYLNATYAATGALFNVRPTATTGVNITLCLNGKGSLSCQNYTVPQNISFSVSTTIPNHTYSFTGIKVNTPGYTLSSNLCTPYANGYCLFSVDNQTTQNFSVRSTISTNNYAIVAGSYNTGSNQYPLLASSADGGTSWAYTIDSSMPAQALEGSSFASANCSGSTCIAAGITNGYPLLATSADGGAHWVYTIDSTTPTPPVGPITGNFYSADCSGQTCVAVGNSANYLPLVATSVDGGAHWIYTIDDTTPLPAGTTSGSFFSVSCSDQICVAAGYSQTSTPLLATSTDGGAHWVYTIDSTTPALPSGATHALFNMANCSGSTCIVAGTYYNGSGAHPLLATSTDGGLHWVYTIDSSTPVLPSGAPTNGSFASANCSGQTCVAAGSYGYSTRTYPLLATSTDGGVHWAYTIDSNTPILPNGVNNGSFNSANCSGQTCIAAGNYTVNGNSLPLLATSMDGGVTWAYTINGTTPALPPGILQGQFNTASCSGQDCVAAGLCYDTSAVGYPLLATSKDGGVNWAYTIYNTSPLLPMDYSSTSIGFTSTSTSSLASLLPQSLGFIAH